MTLTCAALVPGLPHLLNPVPESGHEALARAMAQIGDTLESNGVKRILYYSTQWLSVLGTLVQAQPSISGVHVDASWHQLGEIPFSFKVDSAFAEQMSAAATAAGFRTQAINYEGFPIDTGTIVANSLINRHGMTTGMVSSWLYAGYEDTVKFGQSLADALAADTTPTAVIAVSSLSGNYFPIDIDPREDHISSPEDDEWNQRIIALLSSGSFGAADLLVPTYAKTCRAEVGFKALAFLRGIGAAREQQCATCLQYGAIHGTGAAVIEFSC
jgi:2-aminophenol/2-amino-5-chlorophenol 1,6-dioxygenase subunit alpha